MKIGIYPGSFNPWHKGHTHIVEEALEIFDKVIIAVGYNPEKLHPMQTRGLELEHKQLISSIEEVFKRHVNKETIEVTSYSGLLVEFVNKEIEFSADEDTFAIIKGLRNAQDFEYEKIQQYWNEDLGVHIPTYYIITDRTLVHMSSTAVKAVKKFKGE